MNEEKSIPIVLLALFSIIVVYFVTNLGITKKYIAITSPKGGVQWQSGQTYQINWKAKGVKKVGIVLFGGDSPQWIAKNIPAKKGSYKWQIFVYQKPSDNYQIAVFQYPWRKGGAVSYSAPLEIMGPKFASCDYLSIHYHWPFIPSNYPKIKRVFITKASWSGNLGGLKGADDKCQKEAQEMGLGGKWVAFLGDDSKSARERLNSDNIFVSFEDAATLPDGETCHRLLGANLEELLEKFSLPVEREREEIGEGLLSGWQDVWLGRISNNDKKECMFIPWQPPSNPQNCSLTTTCQNWHISQRKVIRGNSKGEKLPQCYNAFGRLVNAASYGGVSSGLDQSKKNITLIGRYCDEMAHLLCIEE